MSRLKTVGSTLSQFARAVGHGLLDLIYPPRCLDCGARPDSPALPLCPRCLHTLERAPRMGVAARLDRLPVGRGLFEHATALWVFDRDGPLQTVQHALKYGNRPRYGVALGRLLGEAYADEAAPPDGIVPIPLHHVRKLERGYNQSRMIAEGVAEILECPLRPDLLSRPHATRPQTHLSRTDRWHNVRDAFAAETACRDSRWLLIDDVLTTGSTAVAAGRTLTQTGADAVSLATLALARQ